METISFARGIPAADCLPSADLADCARAAIERDGPTVLNYGPGGGYDPLRGWLAERHRVEPERVVLTNGSLQGFLFLAHCLARRGPVLVESPTYDRPLKLLEGMSAEVFALPLDDEGLDVDSLELLLRQGLRPSFLYTIPTFQNPSGKTLSKARRRRLVRLARQHDLLLVEDDPYGLVRFEGQALPTLFELDGGANVVYGSSFSKTVAPGLRVGYLVLPPGLASEVEAEAASTYITPALLPQATTYEYLERGLFEGNLARTREALQVRRDAMLGALARELPDARWTTPEAVTSSGWSYRKGFGPNTSPPALGRPGSHSCPARTSSWVAAASAPCGSPTAWLRRPRSTKASPASRRRWVAACDQPLSAAQAAVAGA